MCHGKRGQVMQSYRTGHEDRLGALDLVPNASVLWANRCLNASSRAAAGPWPPSESTRC
ncbi:hypothetical protein GTY20_02155 [Streptomyces sp. SID4946]|nr:hypothetical protein [Streptomyces sp. SID4946]